MPASFSRIIVIVLDSVGAGALEDAAAYGDEGSNTLANIARAVGLRVPTLRRLGLDRVVDLGGSPAIEPPRAAIGRMAEASAGKDSVTGHWEMMGVVLERAFPVFPNGFPKPLMEAFEHEIGRRSLGNYAASGTRIIDDLGADHMRTGHPIVYTSADSVFQIAAHEDVIPVDELYRMCEIAFELAVRKYGLGRVIARPFIGVPGNFRRTANRKDFAMPPIDETVLDRLVSVQLPTIAVGKIEDLFAGRGITRAVHTKSDDEGMDAVAFEMASAAGGLIFANLVDFDTVYGHRNDVAGFAENLERFDRRLDDLVQRLQADDLLIVTADHGNDPTTPSTDHSREHVPLLATGARVKSGVNLGTRATFADLGQTIADNFGVGPMKHGQSFLRDLLDGEHPQTP